MSDTSTDAMSRRAFVRGAMWSVPVLGVALGAPAAVAQPEPTDPPAPPEQEPEPEPAEPAAEPNCGDPDELIDNCVVQLPEEFGSTSFSTSSVAGGTNYSILFSTRIAAGPLIPPAASGYRIDSVSIAGTKPGGAGFSMPLAIGEGGARGLGAPTGSSLGFVVDVPWTAGQLVRSFAYTYDVVYLNGMAEIQTCTYVTAMTLADNGMVAGGVGSVDFSPPRLTSCNA